jgi:hypothetical protein
MEINEVNEDIYKKAKKKVKIIRGFYIHLGVFILVNSIVLIVISMIESDVELFWEYYPIAGWGIGLAFHYFIVFGFDYVFGKNWEEKKIREILNKDKTKF